MLRRYVLPVALALAACGASRPPVVPPPPPPPIVEPSNPQAGALQANLWVQASAEYRALCLQVYRNALDVVLAAHRARGGAADPPSAVVLDLDETVIDNSGYQTWLYRNRAGYSSATWASWSAWQADPAHPERARAVPGAVEFLQAAERAGVRPIFMSNRRESEREATAHVLERLGLDLSGLDERLLLRTNTAGKEPRREQVRARYRVLAYFGDNLADFSPEYEAEGANWRERIAAAEAAAGRWGADWFVLPNPTYGDWLPALGDPLGEILTGPERLP